MMNLICKDVTKYVLFCFSGHELSYTKKYAPYTNCDNMMDFVICLRNCEILAQENKSCIIVSLCISVLLQQCITSSQITVGARLYILCVSQLFSLMPDIQDVFKKIPNFCYKDFILRFKYCPLQSSPLSWRYTVPNVSSVVGMLPGTHFLWWRTELSMCTSCSSHPTKSLCTCSVQRM